VNPLPQLQVRGRSELWVVRYRRRRQSSTKHYRSLPEMSRSEDLLPKLILGSYHPPNQIFSLIF
jgi:hypothetical protein